jgi:flagellar biosynthesis/type III secretory pathway protein FliH
LSSKVKKYKKRKEQRRRKAAKKRAANGQADAEEDGHSEGQDGQESDSDDLATGGGSDLDERMKQFAGELINVRSW